MTGPPPTCTTRHADEGGLPQMNQHRFTEHLTAHDILHHGLNEIIVSRKTDFQHLYIVDSASYGKALILDGKWQSAVDDEFLYHEPLVHPACVYQGGPRRALVLGGGEGATVREVLRWKTIEQVVMLDIDPEVVSACRQHLPEMHQGAFENPRTELIIGDALEYLDRPHGPIFDVIISDLSDPVEDGPSYQLFTQECFAKTRRLLAPCGIFAIQAGATGLLELPLYARLINTLNSVFAHVVPYATFVPSFTSLWGFALASDIPIDLAQDPAAIDRLLSQILFKSSQSLRMFDGRTMLGMVHLPRHIRQAIEQETRLFTLAEPAVLKI